VVHFRIPTTVIVMDYVLETKTPDRVIDPEVSIIKDESRHVEATADRTRTTWDRVKAEADEDEAFQHSLTTWQALKTYRAVHHQISTVLRVSY